MPERDLTAALPVFPFIVGCPRSGTTLLQAMLDAHPEVAVPPESHFMPRLARRFSSGWQGNAKRSRFIDALFEGRRFEFWDISREEVAELLDKQEPEDLQGAIRMLFATWAERAGKPAYADKTPRYVEHLERLGSLFGEARFVHLIRDGRNVGLSLAASFERGPQTAAQAALYWSVRVRAGREQGQSLGPDRYLELRYEDLVADPEPNLRRLCEFCGFDFDPAMLSPQLRAAGIIAGYPDADVHPNLDQPVAGRRDWREQMDAREVRNFELLAGDLLSELGYPIGDAEVAAGLDPERRELVAAELERLRHALFRANRKADRRAERLARQQGSRWSRLGRPSDARVGGSGVAEQRGGSEAQRRFWHSSAPMRRLQCGS